MLGTCFIAAMGSSNLVLTFFVTNNTPRPVVLEHPFVIRQKEQGFGEYQFELWGGLNETTNLMPGGVATLNANLSGSEQRIEFLFWYLLAGRCIGSGSQRPYRQCGQEVWTKQGHLLAVGPGVDGREVPADISALLGAQPCGFRQWRGCVCVPYRASRPSPA